MTTLRALVFGFFAFTSGCQVIEDVGAGFRQPHPDIDTVDTTDTIPPSSDDTIPPEAGGGTDDSDESAGTDTTPAWEVTDDTDTVDTADTDVVPPVVPTALGTQLGDYPQLTYTELAGDICPPDVPTNCQPMAGWLEDDIGPRPVQRHPAACTKGGWAGPADDSLVCLFDMRWVGSSYRGAIRTLDPATGTWTVPRDGIGDFVAAGLLERGFDPRISTATEVNYLDLVDLDGDGQVEILAASPLGLVFERQPDGRWAPDPSFDAAWRGAGFTIRPIPGVWDIDGNGLLDILLMSRDSLPWTFFQQPGGGWVASQNFERLPGARSDLYTWLALPGPDGSLTIWAMGSPMGGSPTGVFVRDGTTTDGWPRFVEQDGTSGWSQLAWSRPMGGLFTSLDGDNWPDLLVSTSSNDLCFSAYGRDPGSDLWFDNTGNVPQLADWSLAGGQGLGAACVFEPGPPVRPIPWEMGGETTRYLPDGQVATSFLTPWGHDGRGYNGTCPGAAECPTNGQPITAHMAVRGTGGQMGMTYPYPPSRIGINDTMGADATRGNHRQMVCADFDNDGDADCVVSGVYEGNPKYLRNDSIATGNRFCGSLAGNGVTVPRNGSLSRVTVTVGGVEVLREQPTGYRNGLDSDFCLDLGNQASAQVEVVWPDGSQTTHNWAIADGPHPLFAQP